MNQLNDVISTFEPREVYGINVQWPYHIISYSFTTCKWFALSKCQWICIFFNAVALQNSISCCINPPKLWSSEIATWSCRRKLPISSDFRSENPDDRREKERKKTMKLTTPLIAARPRLWRRTVGICWKKREKILQRRHNERDGVSNHRHLDCLFNRLFRYTSKNTSKLRVTGLCKGNLPVTGEFPAQRASNAENVYIWWRHCALIREIPQDFSRSRLWFGCRHLVTERELEIIRINEAWKKTCLTL